MTPNAQCATRSGDDGRRRRRRRRDGDGDGEEKEDGEEGAREGARARARGRRDVARGRAGGVRTGRDAGAGGEENERDDDDGNDDGGERRSETRERALAGVADGEREERAIVARGVRAARRERGTDESHSPVGGVDERRTDAMRGRTRELERSGRDA